MAATGKKKKNHKLLAHVQYHDLLVRLISDEDSGKFLVVSDFGGGKHEQSFEDLHRAMEQFEADTRFVLTHTTHDHVRSYQSVRAKSV